MKLRNIAALLLFSLVFLQVLTWGKPTAVRAADSLPYTFFITRYEYRNPNSSLFFGFIGSGVVFHDDGQEFANASDGSSIVLSGQGLWDPGYYLVEGGGNYTMKDPTGVIQRQGWWKAVNFTSFIQWPGWVPQGFTEESWQGPPGSVSFAGNLTLTVSLEKLGTGVLSLWCIMSFPPPPAAATGHFSDAMSLIVGAYSFTNSTKMELNPYDGNMFYGPGCCSQAVGLLVPPAATSGNVAAPDQWGWSWYVPIALAAGFVLGLASLRISGHRRKKAAVQVD